MRKHLIRYLIFWAPAILSAYLLTPQGTAIQIAQWFFGFFMLIGWAVNTAIATYSHPRGTLTFILAYFGVNAILITALVEAPFRSVRYIILNHAAGAFTYRPLYMLYQTLQDLPVSREEMWITGLVAGSCAVGFVCGVFYRQIKPNPCRPTFIR